MGLVGAIIVEDGRDAHRRAIGVTDEVLVISDTPRTGCLDGVSCDFRPRTLRQPGREAARQKAAAAASPAIDPRVDLVDQAGSCAAGATDSRGGTQLWTLLLNGAPVPESGAGQFPPDGELLTRTMRAGQQQLFRVVNAAADSFIAPQLVQVQGGIVTNLPLEVFARDGVGLADAQGKRHLANSKHRPASSWCHRHRGSSSSCMRLRTVPGCISKVRKCVPAGPATLIPRAGCCRSDRQAPRWRPAPSMTATCWSGWRRSLPI